MAIAATRMRREVRGMGGSLAALGKIDAGWLELARWFGRGADMPPL
jgi:hypothetical protein